MLRLVVFALAATVAGCYASHERAPRSAPAGDGGADVGGPSDAPGDGGTRDSGRERECGTSTCGRDEICIRGRCAGCCDLPPACIAIPGGCSGALGCGCFDSDPCGGCTTCQAVDADGILCGNCMCVCAAPWTPIETPRGPRPIAELRAGDLVYTVDHGEIVARPLLRVGRRVVSRHVMVRVTLTSGAAIEMSPGHPTADGRRFDALFPGDRLGEATIRAIATVPYAEPYTYDALPASDTGTYFVSGAWLGSTLFWTATSASSAPACESRRPECPPAPGLPESGARAATAALGRRTSG